MPEQIPNTEPRIEPAATAPLEQVAETKPSPAARTAVTPHSSGVSLTTVVLVAAIVSAFSGYMSWHFATDSRSIEQLPHVVTINTDKIVALETKAMVSTPGITAAQAAKAGDDFARKLNSLLASYTEAGDIVINANVVLNPVAATDITAQVMQKLGLQP